jgi:hypothetical protein
MSEVLCPKCGASFGVEVRVATKSDVSKMNIQGVKDALGDLAPLMDYSVATTGKIIVKPKMWLQSEFGECNERLKEIGAKWVPEGKDSRWEV